MGIGMFPVDKLHRGRLNAPPSRTRGACSSLPGGDRRTIHEKEFAMNLRSCSRILIALVVAAIGGPSESYALGSACTYQGQLLRSDAPFTGVCDMTFGLFPDPPGPQIGATQTIQNVQVSNGAFTVSLNANGEFT